MTSTHIKRLCGGFGDALAEFAGDVGSSLDVWSSTQKPLQQAEGVGLRSAPRGSFTRQQSMHQISTALHTQLTCTQTPFQYDHQFSQVLPGQI